MIGEGDLWCIRAATSLSLILFAENRPTQERFLRIGWDIIILAS